MLKSSSEEAGMFFRSINFQAINQQGMKKLTMKSLRQFLFGIDKEKDTNKKPVKKADDKEVMVFSGKIIPYRRSRKPELL